MKNFVTGPPFLDPARVKDYAWQEGTPWLLFRGGRARYAFGDPDLMREWAKKQDAFLRWTRDAVMFNEAEVAQNYALYNDWFNADPAHWLTGRVLDIGGGWGLFREWWRPGEDGCFVVHDAGAERFTTPPPQTLQRQFAAGLARPGLFVEGFGEDLPYRDGSYDTVAVVSALDHCAQPERVLAETSRVLRPGGRLLIIQGIDPEPGEKPLGGGFVARLARVLSDPQRLRRAIRQRLFHRGDPHMHHFTRGRLHRLVAEAGFVDARDTVISHQFGVAVLEARKHN